MDYNWSGKNILIAEDESHSRLILKVYLKGTNAIIHQVENGQQAIDFCKSNKDVDLILMDMSMPIKSGLIATKEIRNDNADVDIIAQTAIVSKDFTKECLEAGCNNFISKPIKKLDLLKILSKYLDK